MYKQLSSSGLLCLALIMAIAGLLAGSVNAQTVSPPIKDLKARLWAEERLPTAPLMLSPNSTAVELSSSTLPFSVTALANWSRVAFQSFRDGNWEIYLARSDATQLVRLTADPASDLRPRLNRGATRVAFYSYRDGNAQIYTVNTDGSSLTRLTMDGASDTGPAWSPDSSKIAFASNRDGNWEIYVMNADGSGQTRLTFGASDDTMPTWSPDGSQIAWVQVVSSNAGVMWVMNADGTNPHSITTPLTFLQHPSWSPDGTRLAFDYDADGDYWNELAIVNPDGTELWTVYNASIDNWDLWMGSWSPDGQFLSYSLLIYVLDHGNLYLNHTNVEWVSLSLPQSSGGLYYGGYEMAPDWQTEDITPPQSKVNTLPQYSRANNILVQWSGADTGPASLTGYDVQYRIGAAGTWTGWLTGTLATSMAFSGTPGDTVYFRCRAKDEAGNVEAWPASANGDTSTTLYTWQLSGRITDNRGTPLAQVPIILTPRAISSVQTDFDGYYTARLTADGAHTFAVTRTGYAAISPSPIVMVADESLDLYLSPLNNVIRNGGFEVGDLNDWIVTGTLPAKATTLVYHTGSKAASIGPDLSLEAGQAFLSQVITLPTDLHQPTLAFMYQFSGTSPLGQSSLEVNVSNSVSATQVFSAATSTTSWHLAWVDFQPWTGQTVTVSFAVQQAANEPYLRLFLDDVSLNSWLTPIVNDVSPSRVEAGISTSITVTGENFVNLPGEPTMLLDDVVVPDVHWVNAATITATIPATVPIGIHSLWVVNPSGQEGLWPGKLAVGKQIYLPVVIRQAP